MNKVAFFPFKGDLMCFVHVLLNALDMKKKGVEVVIIMEGEAVKLVKELREGKNKLYEEAVDLGLFAGICKACSAKMGVLEYNETTEIPILGEMSGHPAMLPFIEDGYEIITL